MKHIGSQGISTITFSHMKPIGSQGISTIIFSQTSSQTSSRNFSSFETPTNCIASSSSTVLLVFQQHSSHRSFHLISPEVAIRNWYTLCTRFKWSRPSSGRNIHSVSPHQGGTYTLCPFLMRLPTPMALKRPIRFYAQNPEYRDLICSAAPQGHATSMDLQDSIAKDSLTY